MNDATNILAQRAALEEATAARIKALQEERTVVESHAEKRVEEIRAELKALGYSPLKGTTRKKAAKV